MKEVNGLFLPDKESYLIKDIEASPYFAGAGTVQFKKFQRAFVEIRGWRNAIDIGSNCGIWTRVMARCFEKIICFEPNTECHEAFWANNREGNVELYSCALGNDSGKAKLNLVSEKSTAFSRVDSDGIDIEMHRLDDFGFNEVDFIKIDVEGLEHQVIKGAMDTIYQWRPTIIIEQKPNNAELHGLKQFGARNLLIKMGMREVANISGDVIMVW